VRSQTDAFASKQADRFDVAGLVETGAESLAGPLGARLRQRSGMTPEDSGQTELLFDLGQAGPILAAVAHPNLT
jgi:hypothetical protein